MIVCQIHLNLYQKIVFVQRDIHFLLAPVQLILFNYWQVQTFVQNVKQR